MLEVATVSLPVQVSFHDMKTGQQDAHVVVFLPLFWTQNGRKENLVRRLSASILIFLRPASHEMALRPGRRDASRDTSAYLCLYVIMY